MFLSEASAQAVCILADFTADSTSSQHTHSHSSESLRIAQVEHKSKKVSQEKVHKATKRSNSWLTALYLRPTEQQATSNMWPLVPALLLESTPTHAVSTSEGTRIVRQLRKGDIIYRFEPTTRQVSTWEVRIIQRKARRTNMPPTPSVAITQARPLQIGRIFALEE